MRLILLFMFGSLMGSCMAGQPPGRWTFRVESDSSVTHSVVVLVNDSVRPVSITFTRLGMKPRTLVVPPMSHQRTLLAPGPYALLRGSTSDKSRVVLLGGKRYYMKIGSPAP